MPLTGRAGKGRTSFIYKGKAMADNAVNAGGGLRNRWRAAAWGGAAATWLLPLVAMQFTSEVAWSAFDFILLGVLIGVAGLALEGAVRTSGSIAYRLGVGLAAAAIFLLVIVNGAVGFLESEDNPANLIFFAVIAIAIAGSLIGRFRPEAMARAMLVTAAAQVAVGVIGLFAGWASPGTDGLYEVVMGTGLFSALWLVSAGLFSKAAREQGGAEST